jgi:hypothetical protein
LHAEWLDIIAEVNDLVPVLIILSISPLLIVKALIVRFLVPIRVVRGLEDHLVKKAASSFATT